MGVFRRVGSILVLIALAAITPCSAQEFTPLQQGYPQAYNHRVQLHAAAKSIHWYHTNPGDYNEDGEVNQADVVEIARYFNEAHPLGQFYISDIRLQVDGDQNGEINSADITTIARNFSKDVLGGYNIYSSASLDDYPQDGYGANGPGAVLVGKRIESSDTLFNFQRTHYSFYLEQPDTEAYYWVRPVNLEGVEQAASWYVQLPPVDKGYIIPLGIENTPNLIFNKLEHRLFWYHQLAGDYNQDGTVNTYDNIPLAGHFNQPGSTDPSTIEYVLDGNRDGLISERDILLVNDYFLEHIAGYAVYTGPLTVYPETAYDDQQGATLVTKVYLTGNTEGTQRRLLELPEGDYVSGMYWIRPFIDYPEYVEGVPSNAEACSF